MCFYSFELVPIFDGKIQSNCKRKKTEVRDETNKLKKNLTKTLMNAKFDFQKENIIPTDVSTRRMTESESGQNQSIGIISTDHLVTRYYLPT